MIEAGLISQLLESSGTANRIGLCQIGDLDFQPLRHLFALEENVKLCVKRENVLTILAVL